MTGRPSRVYGLNRDIRQVVPDHKRGALTRLAAIMARYPALQAYHQGDPRGCALWMLPASLTEPERCYTDGIAVC